MQKVSNREFNTVQQAINYAIANNIPTVEIEPGNYYENIVIEKPNEQVAIHVTGSPVAYTGQSQVTKIYGSVGVQKGKGCTVENLQIIGSGSGFGLTVDPKPTPDRGGSTDCKFYNITISGFDAGVCVSPSGTQNGDSLFFDRFWINNSRIAMSFCQSQTRQNKVTNLKCWGGVHTVFDTVTYGEKNGQMPVVDGVSIAGDCYQLMNINNGWSSAKFYNIDAELIYRIGDAVGGFLPVAFYSCQFDLTTKDGYYPEHLMRARNVVFNSSIIMYYEGGTWKPMNFATYDSSKIIFNNCFLNNPCATGNASHEGDMFEYNGCWFYVREPKYGFNGQTRPFPNNRNTDLDIYYNQPIWVSKYSNYAGRSSFISCSNGKIKFSSSLPYTIGQPVLERTVGIVGVVEAIDGNVITLKDCVKINSGEFDNVKPNKL